MAKKEPEIFLRLREAGRAKVRYGRANLTVERMVSVYLTSLADDLAAHKRGEASDEDVAWAFIKAQVVSHTPSFKWADADLAKLLPRITAVTKEPRIKAKAPAQLVTELEAVEKEEWERWKKVSKQMREQIPTIPKLGLTIPKDLFKIHGTLQKPLISDAALRNITRTNQEIATGLGSNYAAMMKAVQPNLTAFENLRTDWAKISKLIMPQIPLTGLGIDPAIYGGLAKLSAPTAIHTFNVDSWLQQMLEVAKVAKEVDSPDIAEAVEATADEVTAKPEALDLTPLFDRLDELSDQIKRLSASNSIARTVLIGIAIGLILYFIQVILAIKYGIGLPPPEPPSH